MIFDKVLIATEIRQLGDNQVTVFQPHAKHMARLHQHTDVVHTVHRPGAVVVLPTLGNNV